MGQQTQSQPQLLTFYYDYTVRPGQEEEFNTLVKTVGAPVRDKLMADGVILAWGIETPVLRYPGGTTHLIWFSVANWSGVEKVLSGMEAQLQKLAAEDAKRTESAHANKQKPPMTTAERQAAVFDMSKTRDWLARDLVAEFEHLQFVREVGMQQPCRVQSGWGFQERLLLVQVEVDE